MGIMEGSVVSGPWSVAESRRPHLTTDHGPLTTDQRAVTIWRAFPIIERFDTWSFAMPAEITMPQLSDTMTEGTVVKWNKKEGDAVKAGEEVADVETDKAVMPMEAFEGGTLAAIVAKEGTKVPVGGVLAVIAVKGEDPAEI